MNLSAMFLPMLLLFSEPEDSTESSSRGRKHPKEPSSLFYSMKDGSVLLCHLWHLSLLIHV